jgi:hypothetical protein
MRKAAARGGGRESAASCVQNKRFQKAASEAGHAEAGCDGNGSFMMCLGGHVHRWLYALCPHALDEVTAMATAGAQRMKQRAAKRRDTETATDGDASLFGLFVAPDNLEAVTVGLFCDEHFKGRGVQ